MSAVRSAPDSVAASPVLPHTSTADTPRPVRSAASFPVAAGSTSPSASKMVTSATPTPLNNAAMIPPHYARRGRDACWPQFSPGYVGSPGPVRTARPGVAQRGPARGGASAGAGGRERDGIRGEG